MEYTCIIIDDEMKAATRLESLIVDFTDLNTLLVTTEPEEAINRIRSLKPDIVFLDIEMKKNGFDLIEEVRHRSNFLPLSW